MTWVRGRTGAVGPRDESLAPAAAGPPDTSAPSAGALPSGLVRRALATLDPGYFAWVMASGIVSVGTDLLGYPVLSRVTLGVTVGAFVLLVLCYTVRMVWFWPWVRQSLRDPTTAMAYFTIVAGTDVLAVRLAMAGRPLVALGLGAGGRATSGWS